MVKNFFSDMAIAKTAERTVLDVFSKIAPQYSFKDVSEDRQYFYKGDILTTAKDGREIGIEVKQDSRIWETSNVLCEEKVLFFNNGNKNMARGNMQSNYDVYCVVSPQKRRIWVFNFAAMKKCYKHGRYVRIPHKEQITFAYLVPIDYFDKQGALMAIIDY